MTQNPDTTTQMILQQVLDLLKMGDLDALLRFVGQVHPADIADVIDQLDDDQQVVLFELLHPDVAAEVLDEASTETTRDLVDFLPDETIADLLEKLPMDDAADVLSDLEDQRAEDLITLMQPEEAAEVQSLLAYGENTAGRLMTTKIVRLHADWTVEETLVHLRQIDPDTETLYYLYVINGNDQLVGVLPVRRLITSPVEKTIGELMNPSVVTVGADTDQEEVARLVSRYDFFAIPVVDGAGCLLGIITADDVVDILEAEYTEDAQRFGGSQPLEAEYLSSKVSTVFIKRIGWLLVLFMTEMLTGSVMRLYEGELQAVVALAFFVPLMIGTGGNSGSQTTATIIRAIAVGEVQFRDGLRLLWHEARIGVMLGAVMGAVGFLRAILWGSSNGLALTVGAALLLIVIWANVIGSLMPLLAARLKIDPAVISGPVMSTLVDATGLMIYFTLARSIMGV